MGDYMPQKNCVMKIDKYFKRMLGSGIKDAPVCTDDECPNCWGKQQYDGKVHEVRSREHIDLNNANRKLGWIEAYVIKHFEGIGVRLRKGRKVSPVSKKEW